MGKLIGFVVAVVLWALAAWLGIWVMGIGGAVQAIEAAKHGWQTTPLVFGLAKFFLAAPVGWAIAALGVVAVKFGVEMDR